MTCFNILRSSDLYKLTEIDLVPLNTDIIDNDLNDNDLIDINFIYIDIYFVWIVLQHYLNILGIFSKTYLLNDFLFNKFIFFCII